MSTLPFKKEIVEAAIMMRMKSILVDMPKYRCLVGIPAGKVNEQSEQKYGSEIDIPMLQKKAKRNAKRLGVDSKGLGSKIYFTLLKRAQEPETDIATYAAKQEFGSYSENIPSRPFLRTTFEGARLVKIRKKASILLRQCAKQNRDAKSFLEKIGLYAADEVKRNIKDGEWQENSPVTIAIKGSSKPLRDTSTMSRAITAWVDINISQKALVNKKVL